MGKVYGQIIDTSDARPYVVKEREFATKAEADAYALGVSDAADSFDYAEGYGTTSDVPAEDE